MLDVTGLGHTYAGANGHTAVSDLSFRVEAGELTCIVGPSGCGKSTLLRAIAHLLEPTTGEVRLHGDLVTSVPEDLAVVFQDYGRSLFPWMTVRGNVEFPLRARGLSRTERRERATETLASVGLDASATKYPWQLSGGMQQRVAIARALACRPALLLMDEPFASVDAQTRFELEDLLLRVRREQDTTVLLVTHDIDESVYLGDRILVLSTSPASIVAELPVDLGRERDQISTRESETFVHLRGEVARLLRQPIPAAEAPADAGEPRTRRPRWWRWGRGSTEIPPAAEQRSDAPPAEDVTAASGSDAPEESTADSTAEPETSEDSATTRAAESPVADEPISEEAASEEAGPEDSASERAAAEEPEPADASATEQASEDGSTSETAPAVAPPGESKRARRRRQAQETARAAEAEQPESTPEASTEDTGKSEGTARRA